ncbi:Predicted nucleoside-diphosphate sugar epimerase [Candidatus Terasakiella magnetica]|uniref:Predicted nucleoside-diphosphate sugar epimerase n=1 Tax=Candidatus Terasakiella magnetica TaxID=1867952 RepID=A0A1C3RG38_9PROT|nr:nucleoside-diphosphate sugar epimerase/dehydratase [Candidatus Terasakiella magnetica]SCA56208.1 Predicted nucleoside-diphosphate sugar epimerase [Candidatus Terasakiella magnetica]
MSVSFGKISNRGLIAFSHDLIMAALSFNIALYLRLGSDFTSQMTMIKIGTPLIAILAAITFYVMGLYKGIWRYASIRDLVAITKSTSLLIMVFALLMFFATRLEDYPRSAPLINWFVLMALLGGPRFIYRLLKDKRFNVADASTTSKSIPSLLIGAGDGAELFLRAIERNPSIPYKPVGLVAEKKSRLGLDIHGVSVLGMVDNLSDVLEKLAKVHKKPQRLILTKEDWPGEKVRELYDLSEKYGIPLSRLPKLTDLKSGAEEKIEVRPIDVEDLLGRPQKALDKSLPQSLVKGKRVLITGAGGSIGSELVRQISSFGPSEILLLEASEYALYSIDMEVSRSYPELKRQALICNIREASRLNHIFETTQPELVFHAAALKHVPLVEENPLEGILTNAIGTRNVADACVAHNVQSMVQISTDKAVNPTNIMGATKRIAESYAQALDLQQLPCRFTTVRFGNVLGSTGSVVPLFQKQMSQGGPLTVTHEDMTRYFMTVREAVELVLQAAVLTQKDHALDGKICVLDMGEPVKILHLAEQMIRLSGFEPYKDIDIQFTGLRPGEKLFEEIFHGDEPPTPSELTGVMIATPRVRDCERLQADLKELENLSLQKETQCALDKIQVMVPELAHNKLD